jgi:hypothetical protein
MDDLIIVPPDTKLPPLQLVIFTNGLRRIVSVNDPRQAIIETLNREFGIEAGAIYRKGVAP